MSSSADGFFGWDNADADRQSDDSKPKRSLAGILGGGAAAVVFVAGLTFAVWSMSSKSNSRVKKEMVAITTQQEESLSPDENPNQVEEEKSGENVGMLESSSEESRAGTNEDPVNEATESRNNDDTGVSQSSEDCDGYIPKTAQKESSANDILVSLEAQIKILLLISLS